MQDTNYVCPLPKNEVKKNAIARFPNRKIKKIKLSIYKKVN